MAICVSLIPCDFWLHQKPHRISKANSLSESQPTISQSRFIKGRTFYQNGSQWIDSLVQTKPEAKRIKIRFDSPEYFQLIKDHPEASSWLAVGRNVQLLIADTIYEIAETD